MEVSGRASERGTHGVLSPIPTSSLRPVGHLLASASTFVAVNGINDGKATGTVYTWDASWLRFLQARQGTPLTLHSFTGPGAGLDLFPCFRPGTWKPSRPNSGFDLELALIGNLPTRLELFACGLNPARTLSGAPMISAIPRDGRQLAIRIGAARPASDHPNLRINSLTWDLLLRKKFDQDRRGLSQNYEYPRRRAGSTSGNFAEASKNHLPSSAPLHGSSPAASISSHFPLRMSASASRTTRTCARATTPPLRPL
jgi:hypothetical protein